MKYIDIHSHITDEHFNNDRDEVLGRMHKEGIATITVGTDTSSSQHALELAQKHSRVYACVGIHPRHGGVHLPAISAHAGQAGPRDDGSYEGLESICTLVQDENVVALGECGLDYFRLEGKENDVEAEKKRQRSLFEAHITLAVEAKLPLMLHTRPTTGTLDTYHETLDILESYASNHGENLQGNFHFFAGDIGVARRVLNIGFTLSFTGVVTFARDYDDVIRFVPQNMLHAETDAPYVAPEPFRGSRNEPTYVAHIVETLARIRKDDHKDLAEALVVNSERAFGIIHQ